LAQFQPDLANINHAVKALSLWLYESPI